ncbi:ketoacyl-ACP synthase III family protein [Lentzea sp. CC55]|uniref:ketoacyl-ACP synthase III family protein n=1 Tax=Lentzea sp. CC55 TaxID=2884909 RepID=UPI001F23B761|nr:ketoacyl-ACP synthase III family protein [Lentzea sp. CC55]MCG8927332.1 ketoacyl-ACP synthase III family protein [Lentzea sp. CC55]
MKINGRIGIKALSTWLPDDSVLPDQESVAPTPLRNGGPSLRVESLPVSNALAPPEMAVKAAQQCLKKADCESGRVDLLIHAWLYHQGHDVWPVAHYIADQIGAGEQVHLVGLQQGCTGGLSGMYFAATALLADPTVQLALVTTADRFCEPGWKRWEKGGASGFGDGATAALLHRADGTPDDLSLLSIAQTSSSPSMEWLFRGEPDFTPAPMWEKAFIDTAVLAGVAGSAPTAPPHKPEVIIAAMRAGVERSLHQALAHADIRPDDPRLRFVTVPRIDQMLLDIMYDGAFAGLPNAELVLFGTHTGHLGAGDPIANATELLDRKMLRPGDVAVLAGVGAGWTWTTAVVQMPGTDGSVS